MYMGVEYTSLVLSLALSLGSGVREHQVDSVHRGDCSAHGIIRGPQRVHDARGKWHMAVTWGDARHT